MVGINGYEASFAYTQRFIAKHLIFVLRQGKQLLLFFIPQCDKTNSSKYVFGMRYLGLVIIDLIKPFCKYLCVVFLVKPITVATASIVINSGHMLARYVKYSLSSSFVMEGVNVSKHSLCLFPGRV